ncbi:GNAT family N-acetyltransferase [Corynebacterium uterequi]|uniref:Acetyltransferase (GNAT) domain n=1 Tax=Corynebacterium uterequi TaxID=1072256 RepID=A0A0G3HFA7_9CORY|nr:hypothetical protein [Corynebacterium uterequi]AKK11999.1 Acetyltransferase (GNAT) domain [Corynebacterium uterequi]
MHITPATLSDLPRMLDIYATARDFMARAGNPTQWAGGYPSEQLLRQDIAAGDSFLVRDDDGVVRATFMFHVGEDPTYTRIDGAWPNDAPYGTIHRVASDGSVRGVVATIVEHCARQIPNLRADTHRDNAPMQRALAATGFELCGIITLPDGSERLAYQRSF